MYLFSHQKSSLANAKVLVLFVLLLNYQHVVAQSNSDAETENFLLPPYQSVFGGYQSYKEQPVSSWREVNDEVEKIGGWRAYAGEARQIEADQVEGKNQPDVVPAKKDPSTPPGGFHE